jgi:hypothetical protein
MTSPSVDVSMLAKHGSAPASPVLKGLKDGGYFPPPQPKGWSRADDWSTTGARPNLEINTNTNTNSNINVKPAEKRGSEVEDKNKDSGLTNANANANTRKNLRLIGVDFDDVCAQFIPTVCLEHNLRYGSNITEWVVTSLLGSVLPNERADQVTHPAGQTCTPTSSSRTKDGVLPRVSARHVMPHIAHGFSEHPIE